MSEPMANQQEDNEKGMLKGFKNRNPLHKADLTSPSIRILSGLNWWQNEETSYSTSTSLWTVSLYNLKGCSSHQAHYVKATFYFSTSSAAATFASRTVDVSDFSIGVDMPMVYGGGILTGSAEILRRNVSDDGTSFTFLGDTGNTASAATDFTGLELGVGYDVELVTGTMNFGVSGMIGKDDASAYGLTAGYRVSF